MAPLYAHLGRDPVPKALMQSLAPNVYRWVERMNQPQPLAGEFLAGDEIPGGPRRVPRGRARINRPPHH